ncbi:little elongation complex subunit 1 [Drosophila biarmipes]|uniref:little elongation complex subunit 1 n=1 Tax=Drosophila biarmipes TaxID=125945 RepID=UPI0007E72593|nr:little elongation complex subunit 1 [Drosophila biarmipes]
MDLAEFSDFNIDQLLGSSPPLQDGLVLPYKQVPLPRINQDVRAKRSRLAERIAQNDELVRQVKQLQAQNKQLADLQRTAQEVTDLYQKEKQQRIELEKSSRQIRLRCEELEKELDVQVQSCENLQDELQVRGLPVDAKDVLSILMQLSQRLGDDCGLLRRDLTIMKKLKEHCKTLDISVPTPKSPNSRNKRKSHQSVVNQSTQTDKEPVNAKPAISSVGVQVEGLIETRNQATQHKNTTTTRGTTTASFIRHHDVGTCFPEPKPLPNVRQILDEMLAWRADVVIEPMSPPSDPQQELEELPATASVATCTTLCDIHREIDFLSELPTQIKVSASRPPSRTMLDSVKEEARSSRELAKELLNFLPQNQSCLANLPPQAFEELWQVFGQMVLGLLQRRSNPSLATPPSVSQADFTSWLYELYEGTQSQTEQSSSGSSSKRDFATSTECMDVGTDPIIESPNISHGGDVTPIRLPSKPRERKRKTKKRKAVAVQKPIPKRNCLEMEPARLETDKEPEEVDHEQKPETAIQFLSNLKTFNMANCDNLDMELDEEERYLLQLTSNAKKEEKEKIMANEVSEDIESPAKNTEFLLPENINPDPLTAVQREEESSLKDDEGKPASMDLPLLPQATQDLAENYFKKPEIDSEIMSTTDFAQIEAIPSQSFLNGSDFDVESNERKETSTKKRIYFDLNSCEEVQPTLSHQDNVSAERSDSPSISSDLNLNKGAMKSAAPSDLHDILSEQSESLLNHNDCGVLPSSSTLFGGLSGSDMESDTSECVVDPELSESEYESEEECKTLIDQTDSKKRMNTSLFGSDSDSDEDCSEPEGELEEKEDLKNQTDVLNSLDFHTFGNDSRPEKQPFKDHIDKNKDGAAPVASCSLPLVTPADLITTKQPLVMENIGAVFKVKDSQRFEEQTSSKVTQSSSDDSEDEQSLVIDEPISPKLPEEPPIPAKRKRTQSEVKTPSPSGEVRLTRQRAKQLLNEQKSSPEKRSSLVDQIRNQLRQGFTESENLQPIEPEGQKAKKAHLELEAIKQSYTFSEESPASPVSEPTDELIDPPTEIPLQQAASSEEDGQPKALLQHVIEKDKVVGKLIQAKRKTLGKLQPQLCASIGKYLQETMQLESSCSDLALEIYKVTKDEAVIVNAMITVICKIGTDGNPVERLINALQYFNFSQRFLAELEERLFRNTKERPAVEMALKYLKLYLKAVSLQAAMSAGGYQNPARLLLAKILYHFDQDVPPLVLELLRHFPTVLPHREQREYDNSDALITVIKHLLMSRQYDMQDPEGAERVLLSKLRFEYHFQPFEPTKQQVLENLVGKLKAGRLEELGYAFALFCRRSAHLKVLDNVLGEHLMPLATSYCDLAAQDKAYDVRLVHLLHCISLVLKPLPLETDMSAFVGFLKRLLVAVPRSGVQQAAVQACLRLQRFGFKYALDALRDYRPNYQLDPLTRAMLRCFAERRRHFRNVAANKKTSKA